MSLLWDKSLDRKRRRQQPQSEEDEQSQAKLESSHVLPFSWLRLAAQTCCRVAESRLKPEPTPGELLQQLLLIRSETTKAKYCPDSKARRFPSR